MRKGFQGSVMVIFLNGALSFNDYEINDGLINATMVNDGPTNFKILNGLPGCYKKL
jgi:hypothetical protein